MIHAITEPMAVLKSSPVMAIRTVSMIKLNIYADINTKTEFTKLPSLDRRPILIGITRLGSMAVISDFFKNAMTTCQRNILTEPEVDPVQPPVKAKMTKMVDANAPHSK